MSAVFFSGFLPLWRGPTGGRTELHFSLKNLSRKPQETERIGIISSPRAPFKNVVLYNIQRVCTFGCLRDIILYQLLHYLLQIYKVLKFQKYLSPLLYYHLHWDPTRIIFAKFSSGYGQANPPKEFLGKPTPRIALPLGQKPPKNPVLPISILLLPEEFSYILYYIYFLAPSSSLRKSFLNFFFLVEFFLRFVHFLYSSSIVTFISQNQSYQE